METKDKRYFTIERDTQDWFGNTVYCLYAFDEKQKEIGMLKYKVNINQAYMKCIEVTDPDFLNCGVGHALIKQFEEDLEKTCVYSVKGNYFPEGEGGNLTQGFYERHGYTITKYDQNDWEVSKDFDVKPEIEKQSGDTPSDKKASGEKPLEA